MQKQKQNQNLVTFLWNNFFIYLQSTFRIGLHIFLKKVSKSFFFTNCDIFYYIPEKNRKLRISMFIDIKTLLFGNCSDFWIYISLWLQKSKSLNIIILKFRLYWSYYETIYFFTRKKERSASDFISVWRNIRNDSTGFLMSFVMAFLSFSFLNLSSLRHTCSCLKNTFIIRIEIYVYWSTHFCELGQSSGPIINQSLLSKNLDNNACFFQCLLSNIGNVYFALTESKTIIIILL